MLEKLNFFKSDSKGSDEGFDTTETKKKHHTLQWYEPGTTKKEKILIFKLDFFLLTYACAAFFLKYLDQTNVSNAYVSGMKEDLNMNKDQLSWMNTYFNIGIIVGSIPSTMLVSYIRPRLYLPAMDALWSLCVLFVYKCNKVEQIYALRFLMGFFESSANPATHFLIGAWYKKSEILRRSAFFVISGVIGQAISGFIQGGLYQHMNGVRGLSAWRWLFIFDAILGIPVILYGLFAIPDTPQTTKAFYLNEWERKRCVERIDEDGRTPTGKWDMTIFKRIFGSWQFYVFIVAYSLWSLTGGNYVMQFYTLYLKYTGDYTIPQVNYMPTSMSCVNLVCMLSSGIVSDLIGKRWPFLLFVGTILIFTYSVMLSSGASHHLRLAAYTMTGAYGCFTPVLAGWCNISCGGDQHLRAATQASMIVVGQIVVTPFQQELFPSSDAPFYRKTKGFAYGLAFVICLTFWTVVVIPMVESHFEKKKQKNDSPVELDSQIDNSTDSLSDERVKSIHVQNTGKDEGRANAV